MNKQTALKQASRQPVGLWWTHLSVDIQEPCQEKGKHKLDIKKQSKTSKVNKVLYCPGDSGHHQLSGKTAQ